MKGYIYIRSSQLYDLYDAYKLGKTENLLERESTYITSEIKRGKFEMIIEMDKSLISKVERELQRYFNSQNLHIKLDGGNEFYSKEIHKLIIPYLNTKYSFRVLSEEEIDEIIWKKYDTLTLKPRKDQEVIINKVITYLNNNDKGILSLTCGMGKTLISLWSSQKLNYNKILIGVPNKLLVSQWEKEIIKVFPIYSILLVKDSINIEDITQFLNLYNSESNIGLIVITTYSSCHKVLSSCNDINFIFDIKIQDECHHLTSKDVKDAGTTKTFIEMLNIPSKKQLSLTATMKSLEPESEDTSVIGNDNIELFGEIIDRKNLYYAIENKILCDYEIQTIITNNKDLEENFRIGSEEKKRLFVAAMTALKSILNGSSHHLLIYANSTESADKINENINTQLNMIEDFKLLKPNLYHSCYHSGQDSETQNSILEQFKDSTYGIITCVYCLGEGWDFPLLDGVVIGENMNANIRIIQSVLRPCRLNKNEPNKVAKIIIPILFNRDESDWLIKDDGLDYPKLRDIIYELGLEDESIMTKVKVLKNKFLDTLSGESCVGGSILGETFFDNELSEKLKLRTIPRYALNISYTKAKEIILKHKNFKKFIFNSKSDYYSLCDKDIRLPKDPENFFKGRFDWIDYLDIRGNFYTKEEAIVKVSDYIKLNPDFRKHYLEITIVSEKLCSLDERFPPSDFWLEYYKIGKYSDIIKIDIDKKIFFKF